VRQARRGRLGSSRAEFGLVEFSLALKVNLLEAAAVAAAKETMQFAKRSAPLAQGLGRAESCQRALASAGCLLAHVAPDEGWQLQRAGKSAQPEPARAFPSSRLVPAQRGENQVLRPSCGLAHTTGDGPGIAGRACVWAAPARRMAPLESVGRLAARVAHPSGASGTWPPPPPPLRP